ncbi:MAG: FkbM family methyltransferase [Solirubrobacterales bacterium]
MSGMSPAARAAAVVLPAMPRGLGDRRIAQTIYKRWLADSRRSPITGRIGRAKLELALDDWPQAQAYLLRRYDPSTVGFIVDHLSDDGVFVEGGSHVGLIAMQVASARPNAQVHSFEPHPVKFESLRRNAQRNRARVVLNNVGLSDAPGELAYDADRHAVATGASGMIHVTSLDHYLADHAVDRVDVMKLDIEGHELDALIGAREALESGRIRAITMESLHGDTSEPMAYLEELGYTRVAMPDPRPRWLSSRREMPIENVGYVFNG